MFGMDSIFTNLSSWIVFIVVLSILILVHEWGHFITAKKLGVKVEKFALGFGPALFSREYKGTTYLINAIPLGGYVKMAGDERNECKGTRDEFFSQPPGHRALIVVNGPVVNFILAYLCFVFVFMLGYPGASTRIEEVIEGGPAEEVGIEVGDKIVAIDGKKIYGWRHLERLLVSDIDTPLVTLTIERNNEQFLKTVEPEFVRQPDELGVSRTVLDLGVGSYSSSIGGVADKYPAAEAGLKTGDRIISLNGISVSGWNKLQKIIAQGKDDIIKIKYMRDGEEREVTIKPLIQKRKDGKGQEKEVPVIGIGPSQHVDFFRFNLWGALVNSFDELVYITNVTYRSLFYMVTGSMSAQDSMTGPIGIFYIIKSAYQEGLVHVLLIMAVISASLAIFNLLPVIPLDGGHLFLLLLEKIRGKVLPPKIEEWIAKLGFGLIILLALFVFYSDIVKFWVK